jgi:Bifunctional DNA primase/polymerase, N-terminal/Primase C terminal 1 (PriCT-1)
MSATPNLGTRPFAEAALDLAKRGLAVIPCPGDDGKSPVGAIAGYDRWERRPGPEAIRRFAAKHGDANIGIIPSLSGLLIFDVDEGGRDANEVINRAGHTPLVTRTPSGGVHLWYRSSGEKSANLRSCGLAVDVKGSSAGIVIVPPSFRRSTGIPYEFERGTWDDLVRLPFAKTGSLSGQFSSSPGSNVPIQRGERNDAFFSIALREVRQCDDLDALIDVLATRNQDLAEPLPLSEIARIATSAWGRETTGTNWVGKEQRAQIEASVVRLLSPLENGPDALMLLTHLRLAHGARQSRGEPFAISPKAMSAARAIGRWGPRRYLKARQTLIDLGLLFQLHQGGRSQHDPSLFSLGS